MDIPIWLKIAYTALVVVLIPVYKRHYGLANFLWFSDIALFATCFALWTESKLIASIMSGILLPEIFWNVDFFGRLVTGKKLFGLSEYMFDKHNPLFIRLLSLFHVVMPATMIYLLMVLGYDQNAIYFQIPVSIIVLSFVFLFTDPKENINWVFGWGEKPQKTINPKLYFLIVVLLFQVIILITHLILGWIFS